MARLITAPNLDDPDAVYAELLALHDGQTKSGSDAINARLVLILVNHIGDRETLNAAFSIAADPAPKLEGAR